MVERTEELREDIDQKRDDIAYTVDQIQNRMSPGRVTARGRYRMRRWWIDTKDGLLGNDELNYPWEGSSQRVSQRVGAVADQASEMISGAGEAVAQAPKMLRQQTKGNPVAAGLVAFGGGLLVGSILPETRTERQAARRLEPMVADVVSDATETGREIAEDVKTSASEAMEEVKDTASAAAESMKEETAAAIDRAKDGPQP
ncbi:MAG: DUF3618 domain-containing protein [Actinomycetota bacterium]